MKFVVILFFTFFSLSSIAGQEIVLSPVDHLFVPQGFDNNDNVQLVVTGTFPGPCFIRNKVEVKEQDTKIHIKVTALKRNDIPCPEMTIPFKEEITLGSLQASDYTISINAGSPFELKKNLHVAVSNSQSVDEHLYALVEYVDTGFTGGISGDMMLMGWAQQDCVELDKVTYISNNADTVSVLPIMKKTGAPCQEKLTRIEIPVKFKPQDFKTDKILIFVRTMEGKSVNTIIGF